MRKYLTLLIGFIALFNFNTYAEVYKTKDKQGRVIYTDQPAASDTKATIVTLPTINELPAVQPSKIDYSTPTPEPDINYTINIISPTTGTQLQPNERSITISITNDSILQSDHFYAYFMDGNKVQETTEKNITINEPPRGEHKLHVEVMNKYGKRFGQSLPVTIIVFRPIVKH